MSESVAEVLAGVTELLPALRERAQETEDARRISEESIKKLANTRFFTLLQPARYDGLEASPVDFYRAVRLIAGACGSTGWVAAVLGCHPWQLALFDGRAQDEVWGTDSGTLVSSSYAPMGRAKPVDGGFQFSGRWSFSSGCDHAQWVFLGGLVLGPDGNPVDFRTLSFMDTGRCKCPGQQVNTGPLYKLPFASVFSCSISVPVVGMAAGAYEAYVGYTRERVRASTGGKAAEDSFNQVRIAEAASRLDAAVLQIERNISEELGYVTRGEKIPMALRVQVRRDQVNATGAAIAAVDRLFESAGGRALRTGTPIQRFWRDAHAGRVHAINDPEKALAMYGQVEMGLKVQDAWV